MRYVYLLQSESAAGQRYVGITSDLKQRLVDHNAGKSPHTSKYVPWRLAAYIAFSDEQKAETFERHLKIRFRPRFRMEKVVVGSIHVQNDPERYDVGMTGDLRERLKRPNAGDAPRTSKDTPRFINTYLAFSEERHCLRRRLADHESASGTTRRAAGFASARAATQDALP